MRMRSLLDAREFHAVAAQNVAGAIRAGEFLTLCSLTAASKASSRASAFIDEMSSLILSSLRESDSVGRLGEYELGISLPGSRRLGAFDVFFELGVIAHREGLVADDVSTHVGIAEVDPSFPASTVDDLLDVARGDLQVPAVPWYLPPDLRVIR